MIKRCTVRGCKRKYHAKGYCKKHYGKKHHKFHYENDENYKKRMLNKREKYIAIPRFGGKGSQYVFTNGVTKQLKPLIKEMKNKVLLDCIKNPSKYLKMTEEKKMKKKKEEQFDWNNVTVGQIIHFFSLKRWGGRIWEINCSRVKIVKINDKSIRINRLDDNGGQGNEWTANKEKLEDEKRSYAYTKEELFSEAIKPMKLLAEKSKETLKGYTQHHKDYAWYVYSSKILLDFSKLMKKGFTKEEYEKMKLKYQKFENGQTKKIFGV